MAGATHYILGRSRIYSLYSAELLNSARTLRTIDPRITSTNIITILEQDDDAKGYNIRDVSDATAQAYVQVFMSRVNYTIYPINASRSAVSIFNTPNQLKIDMENIGFKPNRLQATSDVFYNLSFYAEDAELQVDLRKNSRKKVLPIDILFQANVSSYLSGLKPEDLLRLLGPRYSGARDHASLLFAATTGFQTHVARRAFDNADIRDITTSARYQLIIRYPIGKIVIIINQLYYLLYSGAESRHFPLHIFLATQDESAIEKIILAVNESNIYELFTKYGMVAGEEMSDPQDLISLFYNNIGSYSKILARPANTPLPPLRFIPNTPATILSVLTKYTPLELINRYEYPGPDYRLPIIIRYIGQSYINDILRWRWQHKYCNNDDTFNQEAGEYHGEINKDDPNDLTVAYGKIGNYRCYQLRDLIQAFAINPQDNIFYFRVPDWEVADVRPDKKPMIDATTGQPLARDFTVGEIKELDLLLQEKQEAPNVPQLRAKIQQGLNYWDNGNNILDALKSQYNVLSDADKQLVQLYLAWLFTYGMWMRFWKGPGTPWPTAWVGGKEGEYSGDAERCDTITRDEHVFIQNYLRAAIAKLYETNFSLQQWINNLPLINYNFVTNESRPSTDTKLITILNAIQGENMCMGHGSDVITRTAYSLIQKLLDITTPEQFNAFINAMLPQIENLELQVVTSQLGFIRDPNSKQAETLRKRKQRLENFRRAQPPFDPRSLAQTGHVVRDITYTG